MNEGWLYGDCSIPEDGGVNDSCFDNLVCTEIEGRDRPLCLAPCTATSDCSIPDVLACEGNVCRIANPLSATCEP